MFITTDNRKLTIEIPVEEVTVKIVEMYNVEWKWCVLAVIFAPVNLSTCFPRSTINKSANSFTSNITNAIGQDTEAYRVLENRYNNYDCSFFLLLATLPVCVKGKLTLFGKH